MSEQESTAPGSEFGLDRTSGITSEGVHLFQIENVEERMGPKGKYLVFHLRVMEPGTDDDGKLVWHNVSLLPQARWKLEEALDAVGAPPTGKATGMLFMGKYVRGQVVHREWEGSTRDGIETLMPAGTVPDNLVQSTVVEPPSATPSEMQADQEEWDIPF